MKIIGVGCDCPGPRVLVRVLDNRSTCLMRELIVWNCRLRQSCWLRPMSWAWNLLSGLHIRQIAMGLAGCAICPQQCAGGLVDLLAPP